MVIWQADLVAFCVLLCLFFLTPIAAQTSFALLIIARVLEGIGEGVTFPAMHAIWGAWAPAMERTQLTLLTYAGLHLGTVIAQPISGKLCASNVMGTCKVFLRFLGKKLQ